MAKKQCQPAIMLIHKFLKNIYFNLDFRHFIHGILRAMCDLLVILSFNKRFTHSNGLIRHSLIIVLNPSRNLYNIFFHLCVIRAIKEGRCSLEHVGKDAKDTFLCQCSLGQTHSIALASNACVR